MNVAWPIAALLACAAPAAAWEVEEIGTIEARVAGQDLSLVTVIVRSGDEVSPTAFLQRVVGGFSSLSLMSGDGNFMIDATFMAQSPGPETVPVNSSVTYSPDGKAYWLSDEAPEPLKIDFEVLRIEGSEGRAAGSFAGVVCYAESLGAGADPANCAAAEGRFDTPFFVEE